MGRCNLFRGNQRRKLTTVQDGICRYSTLAGSNVTLETEGHHFFNNLLELFHVPSIAKDLIHGTLPSPQEAPRHARQPLESSQGPYPCGTSDI